MILTRRPIAEMWLQGTGSFQVLIKSGKRLRDMEIAPAHFAVGKAAQHQVVWSVQPLRRLQNGVSPDSSRSIRMHQRWMELHLVQV